MTKTELDNLLVEAKHISDGALGFEIQQFNRTALPALIAEVERLRRCLDQAVGLAGPFQISSLRPGDPEWIYIPGDVEKRADKFPDLYAEIKAREEGS